MSTKPLPFLLISAAALLAAGLAPGRPARDDEQEAREEAFAELLTGARLSGWFTDDRRPDGPPLADSYVIARAEKADGERWLFRARVGETGLEVPLYLDVRWAGDTPVITLDRLAIPGMGTFDARVLFHGKSYAGVWRGEDHGGEMAGRIERAPAEAGAPR
jgi:hypothetical protein